MKIIAIIIIFLLSTLLSVNDSISKEKIIIGIHGLSNKAAKDVYTDFWLSSIKEGIQLLDADFDEEINIELCYWADFFYPEPLKQEKSLLTTDFGMLDSSIAFDKMIDFQPYLPAENPTRNKKKNWLKDEINKFGQKKFKGFLTGLKIHIPGAITNFFIEKTLVELAFYFENRIMVFNHENKKEMVRDAMQNDLINLLKKHKNKDIFLISHSMGTIIAYDVLIQLSKSNPEIRVSYFVTLGSPLGIPPVRDKVKALNKLKELKVPDNIRKQWYNFADKKDNAAFDPALEDNFKPNYKNMNIIDDFIDNDYVAPGGLPNYHKEYGYLRCESMSNLLIYFLTN